MEFIDGKWKWSEAEKQTNREANQNLVWITDGTNNKRISKNSSIPEGWSIGRKVSWEFRGPKHQSEESNQKRRQKLLGRPGPNTGNISPKKGLTDVEFYGEVIAKEIAEKKSKATKGRIPWNLGIARTEEEKQNISIAKTGVSIASKGVSKDYPAWNKGQRNAEHRTSYKYLDWVAAVKTNDSYICQHCRENDRVVLQAHHVKSWEKFEEFRFVISNGLTLCTNCHTRLTVMLYKTENKNFKILYIKEKQICSTCHRLVNNTNLEGVKSCSCNQ